MIGFELSRPVCTYACFSRFSVQNRHLHFAPPIGEGEPALVRRALLIIPYIIARFGEKG